MSKNGRQTARKPATKFAHLQKKMQKQTNRGKNSRTENARTKTKSGKR
jgi:hypothetical protein